LNNSVFPLEEREVKAKDPPKMVGLKRMPDCRSAGLQRFTAVRLNLERYSGIADLV
jgi:hypothetical protein